MQMKTSQGFLDIANFAKLISVISVICLVFSIMPKVSICMSTISSVPCIATLEVCHGSTLSDGGLFLLYLSLLLFH